MNELVSLCKRRGFIFQSSEIYGGINSCWDYGPLGVELKNNIKRLWWNAMVNREDIEGIDASILMHPKVWEASGHVAGFTDPLVDCKKCKHRFRPDQLTEKKCPDCSGELTEMRQFNLMFKTFMGPIEDESSIVYLRPETAQGIYVNFLNVQTTLRHKIPFGIAQIGKAFRNEITPGNFIFRTREFEQMEMQYFVKPGSDEQYFDHWKEERLKWHKSLGLNPKKLQFHEHTKGELAHYAKKAFDVQYEFPFGWQEIEGIHNRTDFDLSRHQQYSGKSLQYFDEATKEKYTPYVIETSVGCDRTLLACLIDAYHEEEAKDEKRSVLRFHPKLAPIKVAFFPLIKNAGLQELTHKLQEMVRPFYLTRYDEAASIGRRYRRQDEIGTPLCVTVDFDSLKDEAVTVRDRDSMKQDRVNMTQLMEFLRKKLEA
ncbi:MAG: glycine--tRNA ligase [Deltaproteobacteria bacterium GWA2_38_16]|nr:MAG: glycine--tRNA ligase [Deltaproteobacteria bacterium GWA2_38_16]OGQ02112.1 MAG: glycine--tRNA ligase [Deltaproteobacteria bacterium RIFCSPHIGHO2_02_FULL_38_15]OGQ34948.1 MAG: glycine--tRNA ligase [Deltaproteobacteria bacterium RIFCSPLOWO2_01_FULL_38_9]OGQ60081.1 MAG: glycine--tRNA ligase [Deltaproteobacteria bacterium RIFCSPLOWO2_12_FULL_38_8]